MNYRQILPPLFLLAGASLAPALSAEPVEKIHFSGFGTVGAAISYEDGADYRANSEQATGVGRTDSPDFGVDSVFGLQADVRLLEDLSATVQMQSRRLSDGAQVPYFEWANLKYEIMPNLSVTAGRVVAPVFMVSESRAIGYANTTVRLAPDVYQLAPISYVEGGAITWRFTMGDALIRANFTSGSVDQKLTVSGELRDYHFDINMLNGEVETGDARYRIGYSAVVADLQSPAINALDGGVSFLAQSGIPGASLLRENIDFIGNDVGFLDLGYEFDHDNLFVQAEYVWRDADSETIQDQEAGYVLGGYRLGSWMPFVQYSRMDSKIDRSHLPAIDLDDVSPSLQTTVSRLNAGITAIRRPQERSTWAIGARWDLQENIALKLQADRISKDADRLSYFVNDTPEFVAKAKAVNIYSATLDFIF